MGGSEGTRASRHKRKRVEDSDDYSSGETVAPRKRTRATPPVQGTGAHREEGSLSIVKQHEKSFHLWTANDDLLLKEAMQNIGDYTKISRSVKFSYKYSRDEVEARWLAMLYHPEHAPEIAARMAELPSLNKRVLWNEWEEDILRYEVLIKNQFQFQHILETYRAQFHSSRTAKSLEAHYYRMKRSDNLGMPDDPQPPHVCPIPSKVNPRTEEMEEYCKQFLPDEPTRMPSKLPLTADACATVTPVTTQVQRPSPGTASMAPGTAVTTSPVATVVVAQSVTPQREGPRQEERSEGPEKSTPREQSMESIPSTSVVSHKQEPTETIDREDRQLAHSTEAIHVRAHGIRVRDVEAAGARGASLAALDLDYDELPRDSSQAAALKAAHARKAAKELREIAGLEKALARHRQAEMADSLAVLHGRRLRYYMRKDRIVLGRNTEHSQVDVDLAEEGHAAAVSRRHLRIGLVQGTAKFRIECIGSRAVFVDGQPLARGKKCRLPDGALIEVCGIRLLFEINRARFAVKVESPSLTPLTLEPAMPPRLPSTSAQLPPVDEAAVSAAAASAAKAAAAAVLAVEEERHKLELARQAQP